MASLTRCPKKAICNEWAKRICVKAHYLFNESLRSFLGCGDDEDSSQERTMWVDLAGSLLGCRRLWWMVIGDDEGWWSWAGGDVLEFYLFFISFRKWNKKMQEGIRNLGRVTISLLPWRLMVTTGGGGWWDVFEFYLYLFLLGSEIRKRKKKRI